MQDENKRIAIIHDEHGNIIFDEMIEIKDTSFFYNPIMNNLMGNLGTILTYDLISKGKRISNEFYFRHHASLDEITLLNLVGHEIWLYGNLIIFCEKETKQINMVEDLRRGQCLYISEEFSKSKHNKHTLKKEDLRTKENRRRSRAKKRLRRFKKRR
jgi:hypothetical protein